MYFFFEINGPDPRGSWLEQNQIYHWLGSLYIYLDITSILGSWKEVLQNNPPYFHYSFFPLEGSLILHFKFLNLYLIHSRTKLKKFCLLAWFFVNFPFTNFSLHAFEKTTLKFKVLYELWSPLYSLSLGIMKNKMMIKQ